MDRISGLPEDIISHILSFLSTKSLVQTSVIAKGWKFHWAHVPFLGFTCNGGLSCRREYCNNNINTFHTTTAAADGINYEFESWITDIFKHNLRNLVIHLDHHQLTLPRCLFTCKTLVDLCIFDCIVTLNMDAAVHFPALKKLQLVGVGYDSEDFLTRLFSGCPGLEELIVERMTMHECSLSSPTLARLVIDADTVIGLKLDTPALRYFRLRVSMTRYIMVMAKLNYLVEAHIHLNKGNPLYSCCAIEFLCKLLNVNCLTLSTVGMTMPAEWFPRLSAKFHNLTQLKMDADWRFINFYLERANNLQVLTMGRMVAGQGIGRSMPAVNNQYWTEPKQVPTCLVSKLENIYLVDFEWSMEYEFNMVRYILKNAKILKKMEIIYTDQPHDQHYSNEKLEAVNRLASFEQGSHSCRIVFV